MAFTSPFTAVAGASITASSHNTSYRDNLNAVWAYTSTGDMTRAASAATASRFAIGLDDKVLRSDGSDPDWGRLPFLGCLVQQDTIFTVAHDTDTAVDFSGGTERYDVGGFWASANPTRLTIPRSGYYTIGGQGAFTADTTASRSVWLALDGNPATIMVSDSRPSNSSSVERTDISVVWAGNLTAGQYVELYMWQNSGSALTTCSSAAPGFWIEFCGD